MQRNIEEAFKLYSGDRPLGLFADKLEHNLEKMNALYDDIGSIFRSAGIENFENFRLIIQSADNLRNYSSSLTAISRPLRYRASLGISCPMNLRTLAEK